jgi:hypothetical protein
MQTLFDFAENGALSLINEFLDLGVDFDVNWCNPEFYGYSMLTVACFCGHVDVVDLLPTHPKTKDLVNVTQLDEYGQTALTISAFHAKVDCVERLLEEYFVRNVTFNMKNESVALRAGLNFNNINIIKLFIATASDEDLQKLDQHYDKRSAELGYGLESNDPEISSLLDRVKANPLPTKQSIISELKSKK